MKPIQSSQVSLFPLECEEVNKNQRKPTRKTPHDCLRQRIPPPQYLNKNKIADQSPLLELAQQRIRLLIPSLLS